MRGWLELVKQGTDGRVRRRRPGADNNHLMESGEHGSWQWLASK